MQLDALLPAVPFLIPVVAVAFGMSIAIFIQNKLYKPLVDRFRSEEALSDPKRLHYVYYGFFRMRNAATAMEKDQCFFIKIFFLPGLKIPYSSCKTITAKNTIMNHKWVTFTFQDEGLKPLMVLITASEWAAFPTLQKRVGQLLK